MAAPTEVDVVGDDDMIHFALGPDVLRDTSCFAHHDGLGQNRTITRSCMLYPHG